MKTIKGASLTTGLASIFMKYVSVVNSEPLARPHYVTAPKMAASCCRQFGWAPEGTHTTNTCCKLCIHRLSSKLRVLAGNNICRP